MADLRGRRLSARGGVRLGLLAGLALLLIAAAAAGWLWLRHVFEAPGPSPAAVHIEVEPGASVRSVLTRLEAEGSLRNARAVAWYLRLRGSKPRM